MTHAGFVAVIVLAGCTLSGTAALALGPGKGAHATFEELDVDGNGEVSRAELDAHRAGQFAKADANGDGKLSLEEIEARALERAKERSARMLERHDANKDGFLTEDEMPKPRRAGKFFDRIDTDGNGAISEQEFAEARDKMRKHRKRGHGQSDQD